MQTFLVLRPHAEERVKLKIYLTLDLQFPYLSSHLNINSFLKIIRYNYENPCFVQPHFRTILNYSVRYREQIEAKMFF
jgi:hypothetical protein